MQFNIIHIAVLKCDFQMQCIGTLKQVYVSKIRFVRISWCSISGYP